MDLSTREEYLARCRRYILDLLGPGPMVYRDLQARVKALAGRHDAPFRAAFVELCHDGQIRSDRGVVTIAAQHSPQS